MINAPKIDYSARLPADLVYEVLSFLQPYRRLPLRTLNRRWQRLCDHYKQHEIDQHYGIAGTPNKEAKRQALMQKQEAEISYLIKHQAKVTEDCERRYMEPRHYKYLQRLVELTSPQAFEAREYWLDRLNAHILSSLEDNTHEPVCMGSYLTRIPLYLVDTHWNRQSESLIKLREYLLAHSPCEIPAHIGTVRLAKGDFYHGGALKK